jgi:hypothetical protein
MIIEPTGHFAYVIGSTSSGVTGAALYTYSLNASTGALSPVGTPVALDYLNSVRLQIDPSGQFAYITTAVPPLPPIGPLEVGIYAYAIDASTGALTLVPGSPFVVGPYTAGSTVLAITN